MFMDDFVGPFRVLREIGRGHNAVVYEAHDTRRDEAVALKVLHLADLDVEAGQASSRSEATLLRFVREAEAIRRLHHPNIVRIRDAGSDGGKLYIAMERLHGETLRARLARGGPLAPEEAVDVTLQIAAALALAHGEGIVHRDIKPDNLFLLPDGTAKLMDFGAVLLSDEQSLTQTGNVIGSPAYMAPEQVSGETIDARTDIWGLAATLFESVTGQKPFPGESVTAVMYAILHKRPDFSLVHPSSLAALVDRAMARKPGTRYHSMAEFSEALRHAFDNPAADVIGAPVAAAAIDDVPAAPRRPLVHVARPAAGTWSWRSRPAALLAGVAAVALLLSAARLLPRPDRSGVADARGTGGDVLIAPRSSVPSATAAAPNLPAPSSVAAARDRQAALPPVTPTAPAMDGAARSRRAERPLVKVRRPDRPVRLTQAVTVQEQRPPVSARPYPALDVRPKRQSSSSGGRNPLAASDSLPPVTTVIVRRNPAPRAVPSAAARPRLGGRREPARRRPLVQQDSGLDEGLNREARPVHQEDAVLPADQADYRGEVWIRVRLDEFADIRGMEIEKSSGHEAIDEAAQNAVEKWEFAPEYRDGKPRASEIVCIVEFNSAREEDTALHSHQR